MALNKKFLTIKTFEKEFGYSASAQRIFRMRKINPLPYRRISITSQNRGKIFYLRSEVIEWFKGHSKDSGDGK